MNADMVKSVKAVFQWNITQGGNQVAQYTVDLKNGNGEIYDGVLLLSSIGYTVFLSQSF